MQILRGRRLIHMRTVARTARLGCDVFGGGAKSTA